MLPAGFAKRGLDHEKQRALQLRTPCQDSAEYEEIDDEKLMQVFGVHQPLTYYGYMNMKATSGFPIAQSGDHLVEDAVEAILIEKAKRI